MKISRLLLSLLIVAINMIYAAEELQPIRRGAPMPLGEEPLAKPSGSKQITMVELTGHSNPVVSLSFSPDGKTLVSGSWDSNVGFWDAEAGKEDWLSSYSEGWITSVRFAPNKQVFAAVSTGGSIRLYAIERGQKGEFSAVDFLKIKTVQYLGWSAFSPDGTFLAAAGPAPLAAYHLPAGALFLWDASSGRIIGHWELEKPSTITFSLDGTSILAASEDYLIEIVNINSGKKEIRRLITDLNKSYGDIKSAEFSPDKKLLAIGHEGGIVTLWDAATGAEIKRFVAGGDVILSLAFSPFGNVLAAGSSDGNITFWDVKTGAEINRLKTVGAVTALSFSPLGNKLAAGCGNGTILLWSIGQ